MMRLELEVVLDERIFTPRPEPWRIEPAEPFRIQPWQLDAMIAASVVRPQPLCLITGV